MVCGRRTVFTLNIMVIGMKKKRNCVQIPYPLKVKYHGFWYEKEKELCPNPLSSQS